MSAFFRFVCLSLIIVTLAGSFGCGQGSAQKSLAAADSPLRIAGTAKALPLVQWLSESYRRVYPAATFEFAPGVDSIPAIREVSAGTLELALSSRPLSGLDGVSSVVEKPFVRDGVVFATNASVDISGLSSSQIRAIYGGQVSRWEQLGGGAGPIIACDREEGDSAREKVFLKFLKGTPIKARTVVYSSSADLLDALETVPGTIGYAQMGLLRLGKYGSIRVLALDGVAPSPATLASGAYPWSMTFYLVYNENTPPALSRFLNFVYGPEGQRDLEERGYAGVDR